MSATDENERKGFAHGSDADQAVKQELALPEVAQDQAREDAQVAEAREGTVWPLDAVQVVLAEMRAKVYYPPTGSGLPSCVDANNIAWANRIESALASLRSELEPPPAIEGRGYRRLLVSRHFIEILLKEGTRDARSMNIPGDIRLHAVRWGHAITGTLELLISSERWEEDGQGWESAIWIAEFEPGPRPIVGRDTFWLVGRNIEIEPPFDSNFECWGLFDSEERAVAECQDATFWIAPIILNATPPNERRVWPGSYYPKTETKDEAAARAAKLDEQL